MSDIAAENKACCCGGPAGPKRLRTLPVTGSVRGGDRDIPVIDPRWSWSDYLGAVGVRLDVRRMDYAVVPGLYALGSPTPASPVIVTANYKLTVDIVRRACAGLDLWVLILDTKGINVWCAAGKGTFGTMELAGRILTEKLADVVTHRTVIVPQLGAPGVAGFTVETFTDFTVRFGPVRIQDLARYLRDGMNADADMRRVTFTARERLVVSFLELSLAARWGGAVSLCICLGAVVMMGIGVSGAVVFAAGTLCAVLWSAIVLGTVCTALLLPVLPFTSFAMKGGLVGMAGVAALLAASGMALDWCTRAALIALAGGVSGYLAFNFTGNSTFTSVSGVRREMRIVLPLMGVALAVSALLLVVRGVV